MIRMTGSAVAVQQNPVSLANLQASVNHLALFLSVLRCDRCDALGAEEPLLRGAEHPPQPGYIGARYAETRVMLVGQNPGVTTPRHRERDARYIAALLDLNRQADQETYRTTGLVIEEYVPEWQLHGRHFPLHDCGLKLDQIAFCNLVRCRTVKNSSPQARVVGNCVSSHFEEWLAQLRPVIVVFLGKWAADRGAASVTRFEIPFATVNRDRSLSAAERTANRLRVVDAVRQAVG